MLRPCVLECEGLPFPDSRLDRTSWAIARTEHAVCGRIEGVAVAPTVAVGDAAERVTSSSEGTLASMPVDCQVEAATWLTGVVQRLLREHGGGREIGSARGAASFACMRPSAARIAQRCQESAIR
jgi:hypothetical protein